MLDRAFVHAVRHRLVALQAPSPDLGVVAAHLEIAQIVDSQADVARRFLAFGLVLELLSGLVLYAPLGTPGAGRSLFLGLDLGNVRFGLRQESLQPLSLLLEVVAVLALDELDRQFGKLGRLEHCVDAVIVAGGNRIELVVVALGAAQRQGQERLSHAVGDVVEIELAGGYLLHHAGVLPGPRAQVAGCNAQLGAVRIEDVAG